jgi:hypothetical protein
MTEQEMTAATVERLQQMTDAEMQALWDRLCQHFFLADGAKKQDLLRFPVDRQRQFLLGYAKELLDSHSFVEPFYRFVVKAETFAF